MGDGVTAPGVAQGFGAGFGVVWDSPRVKGNVVLGWSETPPQNVGTAQGGVWGLEGGTYNILGESWGRERGKSWGFRGAEPGDLGMQILGI